MAGGVIALYIAAFDAAIDYAVRRRGTFDGDRLHKSLARRCAVAGIDIDMFAPKASGAMICIAVAFDEGAAMLAEEVFYGAPEFLLGYRGHR